MCQTFERMGNLLKLGSLIGGLVTVTFENVNSVMMFITAVSFILNEAWMAKKQECL